MRLPLYQIDAFTGELFSGNPAAVCPLERWLPDATMQAIAAENNLAETAFFVRDGDAYALRWFTPTVEVDLCGHATLASGFVIMNFLEPEREAVSFRTVKAGTLTVTHDGDLLAMNFPSRPAVPTEAPAGLLDALGGEPSAVLRARDYLLVYDSAADVAALKPDFAALAAVNDCWAAIATAPGDTRHRLRFALLRAGARRPRRSGDRLIALYAHAILGGAPRQENDGSPAIVAARRRAPLHAERRAGHHCWPGRALSRRADFGVTVIRECCRRESGRNGERASGPAKENPAPEMRRRRSSLG